MAKYDALARLLRDHATPWVVMSFDEISAIVDGGLPSSAYPHQPWWAKESEGAHVQASAWMTQGWMVDHVDLARRQVTFRRKV